MHFRKIFAVLVLSVGCSGVSGPTGPTGPVGITGRAGPAGDPGPAGPMGEQGTPGARGSDGTQGPAGTQGPVGMQGAIGPAGPPGQAAMPPPGTSFSVLDFGAIDDGETDCVDAIQRAIDAAGAAGGGVVYLPHATTGIYRISRGVTINRGAITLQGSGMLSSKLFLSSATGIAINIDGGAAGASVVAVRDLEVRSWDPGSATRTSGSSIYLHNVSNYLLENLWLNAGWDAIIIDHAFTGVVNNVVIRGESFISGTRGLHVGVLVGNNSVSTRLQNIYVNTPGSALAGVLVESGTDTLMMTGIEVSVAATGGVDYGIMIRNTGAHFDPRWIRISDSVLEPADATGVGLEIAHGRDIEVRGLYEKGGAIGVHITGRAELVRLIGGVVQLCQTYGVLIETQRQDIDVDGMHISDNSQAGANRFSGLLVAAGARHFRLRNIRSGDFLWRGDPAVSRGSFQRFGIEIQDGASDSYMITGCDLALNNSGGLHDGGTGTSKVVANNL